MSKKKTIVKNLNSIQNFGAIDILCTDKTGTLTQDKVVLEYHLNVNGEDDTRVLRHAYLNSYFQTGYKNLMDLAIIHRTEEEEAADPKLLDLSENYVKDYGSTGQKWQDADGNKRCCRRNAFHLFFCRV